MTDQTHNPLARLLEPFIPTAVATVAQLGGEEAHVFIRLSNDALDLLGAVVEPNRADDLLDSVVLLDFGFVGQFAFGMQLDFLCGRYADVCRGLRYLWELTARAHYTDRYLALNPDGTDPPGPTVEDKVAWLEGWEVKLNWNNVILPVLRHLFPTDPAEAVKERFRPLWERLNQAVHASAQSRLDGTGEDIRHFKFDFDPILARQLAADAREVFAVVFALVLKRFPHAAAKLAADPDVFRECPAVREYLPKEITAGEPAGAVEPNESAE